MSGRYAVHGNTGRQIIVSIRARSDERAILCRIYRNSASYNVSIRARSDERAIPVTVQLIGGATVFQSAPARMSGRYCLSACHL